VGWFHHHLLSYDLPLFWLIACNQCIITDMKRAAHMPVFTLLRTILRYFAQQGQLVAPMG